MFRKEVKVFINALKPIFAPLDLKIDGEKHKEERISLAKQQKFSNVNVKADKLIQLLKTGYLMAIGGYMTGQMVEINTIYTQALDMITDTMKGKDLFIAEIFEL